MDDHRHPWLLYFVLFVSFVSFVQLLMSPRPPPPKKKSFYVLGLFFIGLLIPSNDDRLLGANPYADINASPFVLVGKNAGLVGFDSFMNVIILISVLSIGVSAVYGGSRTLTALAQQGYAPKIFTYVDRSGRPLPSVAVIIAFGPLAYISLSAGASSSSTGCWRCRGWRRSSRGVPSVWPTSAFARPGPTTATLSTRSPSRPLEASTARGSG